MRGREQVVLDLLVDDDGDQHDQRLERRVEERHDHRQHAGDVGADDRQELADDADPQGEGDRRGGADRLEHDPVEDRRQQRQQRPRVEVAAGLRARQLPGLQHPLLVLRVQPAADRPAQARPVGDEVEGEQHHREQLQQHAEGGDRQVHGVVLLVADELLHGPSGSLKASIASWA